MKRVTVTQPKYMAGSWILITDFNQLMEYMEYTSGKVSDLLLGLIKDHIPKENWDHYISQTPEGSILSATISRCKLLGKSPVFEIDGMVSKKFENMLNELAKGYNILVNKMGGYCTLRSDCIYTVEGDVDFSFKPTYFIPKNTKYINLENDPKIEAHTQNYMKYKDQNFSYITNLHSHSSKQLVEIFKEFVANSGLIVYVYTTGMKTSQMYTYFDAAIEAEIGQFIFEFNSGINQDILNFIDYAKSKAEVSSEVL